MPRYTAADLLVDLNILAAFWVMLIVLNVFNRQSMFTTAVGVLVGSYVRRLNRDHTDPPPQGP